MVLVARLYMVQCWGAFLHTTSARGCPQCARAMGKASKVVLTEAVAVTFCWIDVFASRLPVHSSSNVSAGARGDRRGMHDRIYSDSIGRVVVITKSLNLSQ
jgi:hypothetical protein